MCSSDLTSAESAASGPIVLRTALCRTANALWTGGSIPAHIVALSNTPGAVGFVPNRIMGNSGVGILRGPGLVNLDFNLSKDFAISERVLVQFRTEFFNALNHTNLGVPGIMIGGGFGQIVSAADARIIQFALKVKF